MNTNRIGKKWWLLTAAGLTLACFVLTLSHDGAAQTTKKADPKAKTKDKDKAKEDTTESPKKEKAEPPPSTFPARRDIVEGSKLAPLVAMIDEHITKGWKGNSTYPSERCTDHEFIRRASIDIIGRIPTPKEVDAFMKHGESTRRSWLVNAMLDGKEYDNGREYAQNFANLWTVNLMTRSGSGKHYQAQMNDWLYDQFKGDEKNAPDWSRSARALIAVQGDTNKGDGRAANYLLHNLGEAQNANVRDKNGKFDMVPATSRTTRLFLGIRTQCVQCHDHPFNGEWRQDHFWGINTFLRQIDTKGTQGNARPVMFAAKKKQKGVVGTEEFTLSDNKSFNANGLISFERRNGIVFFTDAFMLDPLKKVPKKAESPRREILAGYVTSSPWFAKAFVNRTWGHFFGTSFTKGPVDDFHEQNPVSHPELLDKLAEMWSKEYGHNPKEVIRWICNSQAYGLSSRANKWNDKQEDETLFARMLLKPMTPEAMFASVTVATHPNWWKMSREDKETKLGDGEKWYKQLVDNFGNDEGEEGSYTGTVIQALLLMNGQETNKALTDKGGTVHVVEQNRGASYKSLPFVIQDLYMFALSRPASQKELTTLTRWDPKNGGMFNFRFQQGTMAPSPQSLSKEFWSRYYEDIMWSLLNSNEFILNH